MNEMKMEPPPCVKIVDLIKSLAELETEKDRIDQEYTNIIKKIRMTKEDVKKTLEKCVDK
jgi:hypothetical protein